MTNTELKKLLRGTKIGLTERDKPALQAAQLYFVKGEKSIAECAKKAGCHRQTAQRTIDRIKEIIDQQGMELVTVLVPKGQKASIEKFAATMKKGTTWCFTPDTSDKYCAKTTRVVHK